MKEDIREFFNNPDSEYIKEKVKAFEDLTSSAKVAEKYGKQLNLEPFRERARKIEKKYNKE